MFVLDIAIQSISVFRHLFIRFEIHFEYDKGVLRVDTSVKYKNAVLLVYNSSFSQLRPTINER